MTTVCATAVCRETLTWLFRVRDARGQQCCGVHIRWTKRPSGTSLPGFLMLRIRLILQTIFSTRGGLGLRRLGFLLPHSVLAWMRAPMCPHATLKDRRTRVPDQPT